MNDRPWSINGRFLTQSITGVQRYARQILHEIDTLLAEGHDLTRDLEVEIFLPRSSAPAPAMKAVTMREVGPGSGHVWEQISLPRHRRGHILNLCNTAPLLPRGNIVCIHDLNVQDFPQSYSPRFRAVYNTLIPLVARRARQVVTVSDYSARRIASLGVPRERIEVLPNGHEHVSSWTAERSPAVVAASGPDVVVVLGSRAPHKNVGMLVALADRLAQAGLRLTLVGDANADVFQEAGAAARDNVHVAGRLSDNELAALLSDCLCLAFPSYVEGFGLPPLEAMALGCPVIASDRTSIPEVCGDAALYADPDDPEAWLHALSTLKAQPERRRALAAAGKERSRAFSWRKSALGYLALMARIDGRLGPDAH
ncbi:glycosyltransferase family 4 protein [Terrihabitans sp. B22-R8]|uniref:glycosyltransferase family 4 protein n=1 Tax=Terrihabitans sp. B22-R8 TaxID=3425128 RepID=UPI00403CB19B